MLKFKTYKESFEFFKSIIFKTNEYYIDGKAFGILIDKIPIQGINTFTLENLVLEQKLLNDNYVRSIIMEEAIQRFHPNNIDNKNFWIECRKQFPLISVCGKECNNIEEANKTTLQLSRELGLLTFLNIQIENSIKKLNILEIGFGYGNLFFEIKDKCNYYGIDYIIYEPLKEHKNFIEINESGIPEYLLGESFFDIVYCVNVLQHCSQKDRFKYFKQSHDALKYGGYFLFTEFLMTDKNKDNNCWGLLDTNGRGYTQFFNQLTECDYNFELFDQLANIGFEIIKDSIGENQYMAIVRKK